MELNRTAVSQQHSEAKPERCRTVGLLNAIQRVDLDFIEETG
jgi:hypothetical protein